MNQTCTVTRPGIRLAHRWIVLITMCAALPAAQLSDQQVLNVLTSEQPRDKAIRRALGYLRERQDHVTGAQQSSNQTAMTSLAMMAHFAAGHTLDDVEHGVWLRRSLAYVLSMQDANGYFGTMDASRMYGHGITALMLAEALGTGRDDEMEEAIRHALERAVAVTVNAAQVPKQPGHEGGWHYAPHEAIADLSLSGWQLMSLHATQQVGIAVPETVIAGAVGYARRLTTADGKVGYDHPGADHPAMRGLSMLSFAIGGQASAPEVALIANRIRSDPIRWEGGWFFYRAYYDAVGMSRAAPEQWDAYAPLIEGVLVEHQGQDGSWPIPPGGNEGEYGVIYCTSLAVLSLAVGRHLLPAYQR